MMYWNDMIESVGRANGTGIALDSGVVGDEYDIVLTADYRAFALEQVGGDIVPGHEGDLQAVLQVPEDDRIFCRVMLVAPPDATKSGDELFEELDLSDEELEALDRVPLDGI